MDHQARDEASSSSAVTAAAAQAREEYLEGVAHRVETYESCAHAIGTATASLQELSANLDKMKSAAQQLNAFTSEDLRLFRELTELMHSVERSICNKPQQQVMIVRDDDEKRECHRRHPWNPSTRLRDAQARAERAAQRSSKSSGGDDSNRATQAQAHPTASHSSKGAAEQLRTTKSAKRVTKTARVATESFSTSAQADEAHENATTTDARTTREMIERAVSLAFTDAAAVGIDQSTFEDPRESMASSALHVSPGKKNSNFPQFDPTHPTPIVMGKLETQVKSTAESSKFLREKQNERREIRSQERREASKSAKAQHKFQRKLQSAAFEFQQRKLALQALQARIIREIQYLEATAADLAKRETLLDDAFSSYEQMLRLEFRQGEQEDDLQ